MKQLELRLQKRLLIVEFPDEKTFKENLSFFTKFKTGAFEQYLIKFICKGSEFNGGVVKELVHQSIHTNLFAHYVKDVAPVNTYCYKTALQSFISAIEAQGYYWGENPIRFDDNETDVDKRYKMRTDWERAESRTFNLENTLIFEILE